MLQVAEAQNLVLQHARPLSPQSVPLADALGRVLAENVVADLDMPPYDKAMMDGFAVRCADLPQGKAELTIIEEVMAGQLPRLPLGPGQATRIMTGAPLPSGADAVVQVERTQTLEGGRVRIADRPPEPGMHILYRGREMRLGDTVLTAGAVLRPAEIGLLATVGRTEVLAHPRPRVAVLATGDEVVDAPQMPGPGQIRNSNGPMLLAQTVRAGGAPGALGIARDRLDSLQPLIAEGLRADVLVLSGGVSAGKLDLVPDVLREQGVTAHFHKVEMKPGKPIFFGTTATSLVFGLPGNPVSSLVCFELFVRPALRRLMGHADAGPQVVALPLADDFAYRTDRPTFYPARLEKDDSGWRVRPLPWLGSSDLRALCGADALVQFPAGEHRLRAGQAFPVVWCD